MNRTNCNVVSIVITLLMGIVPFTGLLFPPRPSFGPEDADVVGGKTVKEIAESHDRANLMIPLTCLTMACVNCGFQFAAIRKSD